MNFISRVNSISGILKIVHEQGIESNEFAILIEFILHEKIFQVVQFSEAVEILKCRLTQSQGCLALMRAKCN